MILQQLKDFNLKAYYPYVPTFHRSLETGEIMQDMFYPIKARVPGSVYSALIDEGLIRDPYFEMNSLLCEWVKDRWWTYYTHFILPDNLKGRNLRIRICGMDYRGLVELNGANLGQHANMYTPFVADIGKNILWGKKNTLKVILENAPDEMSQIGYTDKTHTQKARFPYKWDFSARMVQLGLHEPVYIEDFGSCAVEYARIRTQVLENKAEIHCILDMTAFETGDVEVWYSLYHEGKMVSRAVDKTSLQKGANSIDSVLTLENPKLWYPNGFGEQPLYTLEVEVFDINGLSDNKTYEVGIRSVSYSRCDGAIEDSLPYSVSINGRRIYIKGVNLVPLDIMYGDVTIERYENIISMIKEANINLIRVWGGGLIERETLYDLCDRNGIMIWQEFIQSSSGISNVPSKDPEFLKALAESAEEAVKMKRNHVSLTFWSGGNELTDEAAIPSTYDDINIAMLRDIVQRHNPEILMLPTSASGPLEFVNPDRPRQNHDVHGPWKYVGVQGQYDLYNRSDSMLHSEFGVDGMNHWSTFARVMSPQNRRVVSMKENFIWRHHGGDWWDTFPRDEEIFGRFHPNDLELSVKCSQFIQAEGLRYALEANRRRAFHNCGSIVWQFNEPWPNLSGTNLVDYYCNRKLAYYALKNAYRTVTPNMKYDTLVYRKGTEFKGEIYLSSDVDAYDAEVKAKLMDFDGRVVNEWKFTGKSTANSSAHMGTLHFEITFDRCFRIRLETAYDGKTADNEYMLLLADETGYCDKACAAAFYDRIVYKT